MAAHLGISVVAGMDRLLDVIPVHLRFNCGESTSLTRNVIIRNIAETIIPVEVTLPGPPFRIVLGAERVEKGVRLSPGETLPLRVALDRDFLLQGRPACDFIVLRVELCEPLAVDIVAVPEGMAEDRVRQLIATRLQELPGVAPPASGPASEAVALRADSGNAAASRTADAKAHEEAAPASAAPAAGGRPPPPASLADYLGEAPTGAALRGRDAVPAQGIASTARTSRRVRAGDDSPDDSPEPDPRSRRGRSGINIDSFDDDDRPPTPAPEGFEMVDEGCVPQNFCGVRHSPRNHNSSGPSTARSGSGRAPAEAAAAAIPAPAPRCAPPKAATAAPKEGARRPAAPAASAATAAPGPADPATEGLIFLEGVGWCDDYGRTVVGVDGVRRTSPGTTGPGRLERTAKPLESAAKPRPQGKSKPNASSSVAAGSKPLKKISQKDRDAAWDALGGI